VEWVNRLKGELKYAGHILRICGFAYRAARIGIWGSCMGGMWGRGCAEGSECWTRF